MKVFIIIIFLLGELNVCVYSQDFTNLNMARPGVDMKSEGVQKSIYTVIDSAINDSTEIVGIGEPSHGDRTSFNFQMGLLKRLTEKFGFRELLMESDQNIIDTIFRYFNTKEIYNDSVIDFIHKVVPSNDVIYNTKETIELFGWIKEFNITHKNDPIVVRGISFYNLDPKTIYYNYMLPFDSLNAVGLIQKWKSKPTLVLEVWADIFQWFSINQKRLRSFMRSDSMESLENEIKYMKIAYTTYYQPESDAISISKLSPREKINEFRKGQATRDSTMASNVIKYLRTFKHKKAILWAHNMHIQAWRPYQLPIDKEEAPSMGLILKKFFGDRYLTIGEDFSDSATFVASPEYNKTGASKCKLTIRTLGTAKRSKASATILKRKFGITSGVYTWQELEKMGFNKYFFQNIYVQGVRFYVGALPDIVVLFKNLYPRTVL